MTKRQCFISVPFHKGVLQGSVSGPSLFSIYTCFGQNIQNSPFTFLLMALIYRSASTPAEAILNFGYVFASQQDQLYQLQLVLNADKTKIFTSSWTKTALSEKTVRKYMQVIESVSARWRFDFEGAQSVCNIQYVLKVLLGFYYTRPVSPFTLKGGMPV